MGLIQSAVQLAQEAPINDPSIPPWGFGAFAFVVLGVLLAFTMMIKVGR
ncbi:MAG: hypothetical protein Q7L55_05565 [Actinomycetota bacterium]|nr:hypothetical protein [Actinomycetota bacterium]